MSDQGPTGHKWHLSQGTASARLTVSSSPAPPAYARHQMLPRLRRSMGKPCRRLRQVIHANRGLAALPKTTTRQRDKIPLLGGCTPAKRGRSGLFRSERVEKSALSNNNPWAPAHGKPLSQKPFASGGQDFLNR